MIKKAVTFNQVAILLLYSLLFFTGYLTLYNIFRSQVIGLVSIILICYISWSKGTLSGLILCFFNFIWIQTTFVLYADTVGIPPVKDIGIGIVVHILFALAAGYVGTLTRKLHDEIEERKRVEALLKEHRNELEQRVIERTRKLEELTLKLHQAEKMETLGQLTGGIAHDFKNHLTIILGFGDLLANLLDKNSQEAEFLKAIMASGERANELTKSLMNFSRKERYKPQPVDINEIVKETVAIFYRSFASSISIECITAPDLPKVLGGKTQIQNAILNLALNSKDAVPQKNGSISVETKLLSINHQHQSEYSISCTPGNYIGITVSDNGSGIPEDILPHIFEPFFTTKDEGKGTGMGLATIQGMTRQHRGDVFAMSEPGKSTSITMLFPVMPE